MAREPPEADDRRSPASAGETGVQRGKGGLLNRRRYLQLAGAGAAGLATAASTATAAEYEVIELDPGEHWSYRLDDGETFENVLIDQSAPGAGAQLIARGSTNWTIRNVGFKGELGRETRAIVCSDESGGTSRVENVYIGDGVDASAGSAWEEPALGIWVAPEHDGEITFERVNVQGAHDNGFYASAPGANSNGRGGLCHFVNCYAKNNRVSNFRTAGGEIRNCVSVNDEVVGYNPRPLWVHAANNTDGVFVYDSDFDYGAANSIDWSVRCNYPASHLELNDSRYNRMNNTSGATVIENGTGTNPRDRIPEGCPTSPEAAAGGAGGSSGSSPAPKPDPKPEGDLLEISGVGEYRVETDGEIRPASSISRWVTAGESYDNGEDGGYADWYLTGSETSWQVDGDLTAIETAPYEDDLDLTFTLDGEEIDPAELGDTGSEGELEHVLLVDGSDDGVTRYEFTVEGVVEPSTHEGATIDDESRVADGVANGVVANWKDAWAFDGDLVELTVDGPGTVRLDGEELDPTAVGDDYPHSLVIESDGEPASFEVTVDGSVAYDGDEEAVNEVTTVSGTTVQSSVADEPLELRYSGALTDVTFTSGEATVRRDGDVIDPDEYVDAELLPHAIVFDGTEADDPSTYSFAASGTITKSTYMGATPGEDDDLESGTVRGGVDDWLDAYWFDGDLRDVSVLGDAGVHVDYNARNQ